MRQSLKAHASWAHPEPWATCDRCGHRYNKSELEWQFDWRGPRLQNLRLLVCRRTCLDIPQEQSRVIKIGPDPIPVKDPRPGFIPAQNTSGPLPAFRAVAPD